MISMSARYSAWHPDSQVFTRAVWAGDQASYFPSSGQEVRIELPLGFSFIEEFQTVAAWAPQAWDASPETVLAPAQPSGILA